MKNANFDWTQNTSSAATILLPVFIARQHTDTRYWYSKYVCLSVCPLRSSILWKRLNISSSFLHRRV